MFLLREKFGFEVDFEFGLVDISYNASVGYAFSSHHLLSNFRTVQIMATQRKGCLAAY